MIIRNNYYTLYAIIDFQDDYNHGALSKREPNDEFPSGFTYMVRKIPPGQPCLHSQPKRRRMSEAGIMYVQMKTRQYNAWPPKRNLYPRAVFSRQIRNITRSHYCTAISDWGALEQTAKITQINQVRKIVTFKRSIDDFIERRKLHLPSRKYYCQDPRHFQLWVETMPQRKRECKTQDSWHGN